MSSSIARFRICPEYVKEFLAVLSDAGVRPSKVYDRDDGVVAIEIAEFTHQQGQEIASAFQTEWSAIIGIAGGNPFEVKQ